MFPGAEAAPLPNQEYKQLHSLMVDGGDRFGVSCLCFDTQELLWMGNQGVCSQIFKKNLSSWCIFSSPVTK
jgi:hypothetical protein